MYPTVPIVLAKFEGAQMRHSVGTNVGTKQNAHMKWAFAAGLVSQGVGCAGKI